MDMTATLQQPSAAAADKDRFGGSWSGRRVTIVGMGRSGLAAASLLQRAGASVRATDARERVALREARLVLSALGIDEFETGRHRDAENAERKIVTASDLPCKQHPEPGTRDDKKHRCC